MPNRVAAAIPLTRLLVHSALTVRNRKEANAESPNS
jgi:hypothetical protein